MRNEDNYENDYDCDANANDNGNDADDNDANDNNDDNDYDVNRDDDNEKEDRMLNSTISKFKKSNEQHPSPASSAMIFKFTISECNKQTDRQTMDRVLGKSPLLLNILMMSNHLLICHCHVFHYST